MAHIDIDKGAREYLELLRDEGAKASLQDGFDTEMKLPSWYNKELFKKAQKYYMDNIFAMFAGKLMGLLSVLTVPTILDVLIHTKESSTPLTAYKRYVATIFHTNCWYEHDLVPGSKSWQSLDAVRKRHLSASKSAKTSNAGFVSQKDLALTQFGFLGFIAVRPEILGVQVTLENHEAFIHFWRVIGYMMGIEDRFNLCTDSWKTTKGRVELLRTEVYKPYLDNASNDFYSMAKALLTGLWCFNPMLDINAFFYFLKMITGCDGYNYYGSSGKILEGKQSHLEKIEELDWYSRLMLFFQVTVHTYLLNFAYIRWYFNSQIFVSLFLIRYFPFLAFYAFGIQHSYVRILKGSKN